MDEPTPAGPDPETTLTENGVEARYVETDTERVLAFERHDDEAGRSENAEAGDLTGPRTAVVAQNYEGYGMLKVRPSVEGDELERYYGFDMALDHAAELLGVASGGLPIPDAAADMGM